ncbi:MAG: hypothetical protein E7140_01775 [Rikenellaceae bacterium]|nr:hypothetical protein [Rikenellaceae bacterium]
MKGIGKRTTIAFLSIVALLSVSGVISLFELSNLSYDTDAILSANTRDIGVARDLLRSAHDHSRAMIDVVVFDNESARESCNKALSELDSHIALLRDKASAVVQGSLDTLSIYSGELRHLADSYSSTERVVIDSLTVELRKIDGRKWYKERYQPAHNRLVEQVERYITLSHSELAPRAAQLSKNAYRSVAPVLISLLVMIAIVLMFYYFVYIYMVKPVLLINRSLSDYLSFKLPYKPKANMVDEIKELNDNIENLINISKSNKKQGGDAI